MSTVNVRCRNVNMKQRRSLCSVAEVLDDLIESKEADAVEETPADKDKRCKYTNHSLREQRLDYCRELLDKIALCVFTHYGAIYFHVTAARKSREEEKGRISLLLYVCIKT